MIHILATNTSRCNIRRWKQVYLLSKSSPSQRQEAAQILCYNSVPCCSSYSTTRFCFKKFFLVRCISFRLNIPQTRHPWRVLSKYLMMGFQPRSRVPMDGSSLICSIFWQVGGTIWYCVQVGNKWTFSTFCHGRLWAARMTLRDLAESGTKFQWTPTSPHGLYPLDPAHHATY